MNQVPLRLPSQSFRYLIGGLSALTLEYAAFYWLFSVWHADVYIANSCSFAVGLAVSFTVSRLWTFKSSGYIHRQHRQMILYCLLAAFNLLATNLMLAILTKSGLNPQIGKIIVIVVTAAWNFIIMKHLIFKQQTGAGI